MEINKIIKNRRLELGLTLKDVANALNIAESTISRYETSEIQNMGIDKIEALSKVLQCSPAYLMGWTDEIEPPRLSHIDEKDLTYLISLGQKLGYKISRIIAPLGDSFVVTRKNEKHDVLLANHEILELLNEITQTECDIFKNTIDNKYNAQDYYLQPSDEELLEKTFIKPISTSNEAQAYLSTLGLQVAAFGGERKLTNESLIEIANLLRTNQPSK